MLSSIIGKIDMNTKELLDLYDKYNSCNSSDEETKIVNRITKAAYHIFLRMWHYNTNFAQDFDTDECDFWIEDLSKFDKKNLVVWYSTAEQNRMVLLPVEWFDRGLEYWNDLLKDTITRKITDLTNALFKIDLEADILTERRRNILTKLTRYNDKLNDWKKRLNICK